MCADTVRQAYVPGVVQGRYGDGPGLVCGWSGGNLFVVLAPGVVWGWRTVLLHLRAWPYTLPRTRHGIRKEALEQLQRLPSEVVLHRICNRLYSTAFFVFI